MNYRKVADALTNAAATSLKQFQHNNWKVDGGFLSVLHTRGQRSQLASASPCAGQRRGR